MNRKLKPQFDELDGRRSSVADRLPPYRSISSTIGSLCNRLNLEGEEVASPWITPLQIRSIVHLGNLLKELQRSLHMLDEMASRIEKRSRVTVSSQFLDLVWKLLYEILEDVIRTPRIAGRLMSILRHVKQRSTVDDYVSCFIEVARVVIEFVAWVDYKLEDAFLVMIFVIGLKEEIRYDVQVFEPISLSEAIDFAQVQERVLVLTS